MGRSNLAPTVTENSSCTSSYEHLAMLGGRLAEPKRASFNGARRDGNSMRKTRCSFT